MMLNSLGETLRLKGDYAAARDRYQEALSIARETGHRPEQILCLSNLAGARLGLGEYEEAERLLREAIDLAGRPAITCCRRRIGSSPRRVSVRVGTTRRWRPRAWRSCSPRREP